MSLYAVGVMCHNLHTHRKTLRTAYREAARTFHGSLSAVYIESVPTVISTRAAT
jgi:hypothetical protein